MDLSDTKSEENVNIDTTTPFETLTPLPVPLCQSQCVIYKDEILICGGYYERNCYSYHTLKNQYKRICSYPSNVVLEGHCVVRVVSNNKDKNTITLLSFSGYPKHTLMMTYVSIWDDDESNVEEESKTKNKKHCNEWVTFIDDSDNKRPIHIAKDTENYEGARAVIGGSNKHLLFITYPPKNVDVFDLNTCRYIKHDILPMEENKVWYHGFVSTTQNTNEMLLFYNKTGLTIDYNENSNEFKFYAIPVCDEMVPLKRYANVCIGDVVVNFGGWSGYIGQNEAISNAVHMYSMKESKWIKLEHVYHFPYMIVLWC
ncbi:hypothetical protein RFI_10884 [Reticulomyxa filosa]|uniref:Uncharacterized protein n=1 Tax=Reticulomyxa filosa TaxID=46433 RepID=X6NJV0_RETFI|nr:hypothetical protein RFI_10884 [Reticulomyxa filosa]|eukprot:ETO26256.1 hypothetical protein RFI_10884 [Reticulomyxa filosa]